MTNLQKLIKQGFGYVTVKALEYHYHLDGYLCEASGRCLGDLPPETRIYFEGDGNDLFLMGYYYHGDELNFGTEEDTVVENLGGNLCITKL
ncbi:hypothetical protein NVP1187O_043 [Vibrio phage 1.187.O._10N.286.49.F1]|nr:hypothetical protein NVP1187O_043 [Vibrio phage 1.187.O._10N.286.49.F1]